MYASQPDITDAHGENGLYAVTDNDGVIDVVKIEKALARASAKINSYIGVRFTLPLPLVPDELKSACVDMAVYYMSDTADVLTEIIENRHNAAMGWIKDVAAGRASLGLPTPSGKASARPVILTGTERLFTREKLRGM